MKCSVKNCPNTTQDNPDTVSFHGFPTNVEVLHKWVSFTGRTNFIPKISSRICSAHFDDDAYSLKPKTLKFRAVPTLLVPPRIATNPMIKVKEFALDTRSSESDEKDPLACDFTPEYEINQESVSSSATVLSKTNIADIIILNHNQNQVQPSPSTGFVIPPADVLASSSIPTSGVQSNVAPIKLVDMNKLLKKSTFEQEVDNSVSYKSEITSYTSPPQVNRSSQNMKSERITPVSYAYTFGAFQKTSISKILECLRIILPAKYDLTKLVPNEKISFLVLRYLKLEDNEVLNNRIQSHLKIIVDTANTKVTEYGDDFKHPYHKITDEILETTLKKCLPQSFSMSDVSNDVLNCLCFLMEQDIFSDGYHILRRKIRKYTREGLIFNKIMTQTSETNMVSKLKIEDSKISNKKEFSYVNDMKNNVDQGKAHHNDHVSKEVDFATPTRVKSIVLEKTISKENNKSDRLNKFKIKAMCNTLSENYENSSKPYDGSASTSSHKKSHIISDNLSVKSAYARESISSTKEEESSLQLQIPENLKSILTYLKNQHCSAKDALHSFRLMFYLCKFLQVRCNKPNLQKVKLALQYIAEKKISLNYLKEKQLVPKRVIFEPFCNVPKVKIDKKLKMTPIVKLHNLADYKKDHLVFMSTQKQNSKTGYYSQIVPNLGQSNTINLQRFTNDYIQKLTNEDYKTFRNIIVKKRDSKLMPRIKYKRLVSGCSVFVKDFRTPSIGWVKGKVTSSLGHLMYTVQLDSGGSLQCVLDQIRPVPEFETLPSGLRTPRAVKPKQMFDL